MPYGPRKSSDAKGVRGEEAGKRQRQRRAEDAEGASRLKNITPGAPGILETVLVQVYECTARLRFYALLRRSGEAAGVLAPPISLQRPMAHISAVSPAIDAILSNHILIEAS